MVVRRKWVNFPFKTISTIQTSFAGLESAPLLGFSCASCDSQPLCSCASCYQCWALIIDARSRWIRPGKDCVIRPSLHVGRFCHFAEELLQQAVLSLCFFFFHPVGLLLLVYSLSVIGGGRVHSQNSQDVQNSGDSVTTANERSPNWLQRWENLLIKPSCISLSASKKNMYVCHLSELCKFWVDSSPISRETWQAAYYPELTFVFRTPFKLCYFYISIQECRHCWIHSRKPLQMIKGAAPICLHIVVSTSKAGREPGIWGENVRCSGQTRRERER